MTSMMFLNNLAAKRDIFGNYICELLPTDSFRSSQHFHHFSVMQENWLVEMPGNVGVSTHQRLATLSSCCIFLVSWVAHLMIELTKVATPSSHHLSDKDDKVLYPEKSPCPLVHGDRCGQEYRV
ncbi:hypothetical protein pdam_00010662 [Pocillopora damicornis]|uniref:Uncharacterized protein n=1 Tax=Pocillopora damicornis TaxID=46731 RepID=A0A3M6T6V3_POCDA|nr:hypothetical protein pdam_00010662 [Pocillopora damicornis]